MKPYYEKIDKCLFCDRKKEENTFKKWYSNIEIRTDYGRLAVVTICPDCRKNYTIEDVYIKVIEGGMVE